MGSPIISPLLDSKRSYRQIVKIIGDTTPNRKSIYPDGNTLNEYKTPTNNDTRKLKANAEGDSTRFLVQKLNIVFPELSKLLINNYAL
jgi:hypothetical protein